MSQLSLGGAIIYLNIGQWPESSAAFYYVPVNGGGCRTEYIVLVALSNHT